VLHRVDFPDFVPDPIHGVFDAVVEFRPARVQLAVAAEFTILSA
jgi:hypothetical protein